MVTMHRGSRWKISVYGREHGVPHFHVESAEFRCSVDISSPSVSVGTAPGGGLAGSLGLGGAQPGFAGPDMAGVEWINNADNSRSIEVALVSGPTSLDLSWSDGTKASIDLGAIMNDRAFAALRDATKFAKVEVGDWGHSLAWPSGGMLGAEMLGLETLSANGQGDVRAFFGMAAAARALIVESWRCLGDFAADGRLLLVRRDQGAETYPAGLPWLGSQRGGGEGGLAGLP